MKKGILKVLTLIIMIAAVVIPTSIVKAATLVTDEATLTAAIAAGDAIELGSDITITVPITIAKPVQFDGKGFAITGSGVANIFTINPGMNVTFKDITIKGATGYGIIALDGALIAANGLVVKDCTTGAILLNGGKISVINLTMNGNGKGIVMTNENGNNAIPTLLMDGVINVTGQTSPIHVNVSAVGNVMVGNTGRSTYKVGRKTVGTESYIVITNGSGTEVAVSNDLANCDVAPDPSNPVNPSNPTDPTIPTTPTPPTEVVPSNPATGDNVTLYVIMGLCIAVVSIGTVIYTTKKLHFQR